MKYSGGIGKRFACLSLLPPIKYMMRAVRAAHFAAARKMWFLLIIQRMPEHCYKAFARGISHYSSLI